HVDEREPFDEPLLRDPPALLLELGLHDAHDGRASIRRGAYPHKLSGDVAPVRGEGAALGARHSHPHPTSCAFMNDLRPGARGSVNKLEESVTLDMTSSNSYFHVMRWLTLLMTLPPTPTRHRVGVWRKLQRMGAVRLRGAGWLLPETPETTELFQWLVQEIQSFRGEVTLLRVDRVETMTDAQIAELFHKARSAEYAAAVQGCREILGQLDRLRASHRASVGKLHGKLDS